MQGQVPIGVVHNRLHWVSGFSKPAVGSAAMRIINFSRLPVPRTLWSGLASALRLDAILPAAERDEFGFYKSRRQLAIVVRRSHHVPQGQTSITGTYCFGRIELRPCLNCTVAFLTRAYVHELVHAWLDQYHTDLYISTDSCPFAERFALATYDALGGTRAPNDLCSTHTMDLKLAATRLGSYRELAASLVNSRVSSLARWRPPHSRRGPRIK